MRERERIAKAVDDFASEIKKKLLRRCRAGCHGWDDPSFAASPGYEMMVIQHIWKHVRGRPQEIDLAAFLMFSWYRRQRQAGKDGE